VLSVSVLTCVKTIFPGAGVLIVFISNDIKHLCHLKKILRFTSTKDTHQNAYFKVCDMCHPRRTYNRAS